MVNIFVPTTPNPTSGFLLVVPEKDVTYLDMSFEEASKFIMSAGSIKLRYIKFIFNEIGAQEEQRWLYRYYLLSLIISINILRICLVKLCLLLLNIIINYIK